ncbi:bifunctional phosphoribosylaminoimidazolecarboxamide formyltransferase/IMP cyclohydrolase [Peptoanaerobacter stomatis]|uniref:bifunctional phosphoribosylaminoimidazolecarboxamide formyltransferase/IMP cyclohydrolase n=1 Tax=Peptoanaerobacter stomatis TaxID=796937 RepID=UPI003F9FB1D9
MRAILSVFDKTGIVEFAKELEKLGVEIISSGGTFKLLQSNDIKAIQVSDVTEFAECLDGRVKTLHPKIHGGILADRKIKEHMDTLKKLDITPIDIVVVNLYPFKQVISDPNHTLRDAIENIDIGGPTMIRSAAKNHESVLVITDSKDYDEVIEKMRNKSIDSLYRIKLAQKAFSTTATYDIMISNYLENISGKDTMPQKILLSLDKKQQLRYGENPHQQAAYYSSDSIENKGIECAEFLNGKELSYNNYNDVQSAVDLAMEFDRPVCVVVKHSTPCGVSVADNVYDAYIRAYETDKQSIFGGIVCMNRKVDEKTAKEINKIFLEVVIAPDFEEKALEILKQKKNIRLLRLKELENYSIKKFNQYKSLGGGFLLQESDSELFPEELNIVTEKSPTKEEIEDMKFAMTVAKHVKSNAIVVAKDGATLGIGGGDVSRIFAAKSALERAGQKANGAVLASDAFFPFEDVVTLANKYNIKAIIQPSGSINDKKSIDECDKNGISMVFTGVRHFRH